MNNFTWNPDGSLYTKYNDKDIPSQIPYSALIRGIRSPSLIAVPIR